MASADSLSSRGFASPRERATFAPMGSGTLTPVLPGAIDEIGERGFAALHRLALAWRNVWSEPDRRDGERRRTHSIVAHAPATIGWLSLRRYERGWMKR